MTAWTVAATRSGSDDCTTPIDWQEVMIARIPPAERCYEREDGMHCECWYDIRPCCACGETSEENHGPTEG